MDNQTIAFESRTLYLIARFFSVDPIYHDIYRDHYFRRFGENLDLSPQTLIEHCNALKQDMSRLYYHYSSPKLTDEDFKQALDNIIKELKGQIV